MITAAKWAREQKVPFLGICLGFQVAVIEWARNVCGLEGAHSAELSKDTPHPVICFMPEISKTHLGGTMRLGLRPTIFGADTEKTKLRQLYGGKKVAWERHRHRYEVEPKYVDQLESHGQLRFIGKDERGERMQMLELDGELVCGISDIRPPVLCRSAGTPRVLLAPSEPVACVPRSYCGGVRRLDARRPARRVQELCRPPPRQRKGRSCERGGNRGCQGPPAGGRGSAGGERGCQGAGQVAKGGGA